MWIALRPIRIRMTNSTNKTSLFNTIIKMGFFFDPATDICEPHCEATTPQQPLSNAFGYSFVWQHMFKGVF